MIYRLKEYIEYKGLNVSSFEKSLGMANNTIRKKIVSGNSNMGTDTLQIILKNYPELSADWLLLGIGEMIRKHETPAMDTQKELQVIAQLQKTISELTETLNLIESK